MFESLWWKAVCELDVQTLFQIVGGVGLFLYGMKLMSDALQDISGDRMRTLIASLTSSPLKGTVVGALVTMVIQSSSGTTVMVVSFVQAGMMSLRQALGVIMGANIGTTVTAQLVAFKIKEAALPLIGIGMMLAVFGRTKRLRYIGNGVFGFGLLFLGMETMEQAMGFLRGRQDIFLRFSGSPLLCMLTGLVMTLAVQSSSATVGLTIAMASQGLLPLVGAVAVLFGSNLGTTVTAVLASLGGSREAKQAAAGHVLFNLVGVLIFMPFLHPFASLMASTSHGVGHQLANAHTVFNVVGTLVQLPFVNVLARLIERLIPPGDKLPDTGPRFIDDRLLSTPPAAAVTAVRSELLHMGSLTLAMLDQVEEAFSFSDDSAVERLEQLESAVNNLNRCISEFSAKLWQRHISSDFSRLLESYLSGAGDLERVGDHAQNMMELYEYLREHGLQISPLGKVEFADMFRLAREMVALSLEAIEKESLELSRSVSSAMEERLDGMEETLRHAHILRLNEGACNPSAGVVFIDLVSNLERIGDHAHNVAKIVEDVVRLHPGKGVAQTEE